MDQKHVIIRDVTRPVWASRGIAAGTVSISENGVVRERSEPPEIKIDAETMNARQAVDAARAPEVVSVAPAMPIRLVEPIKTADLDEADGASSDQAESTWGISAVLADQSPFNGSGVKVAVLDTGIEADHPAFEGVTLTQRDFSGSGDGDRNGHGTHCAGTIFGRDVEGKRIGVARGVTDAMIGKVLSDAGSGSSEMAFSAMSWAVEGGAKVISMSLGFDFPGLSKRLIDQDWPADLATSVALEAYRANLRTFDILMQLIRAKAAFGVEAVIVAAAGNESKRGINPDYEIPASLPAAAEGVISVGAAQEIGGTHRIANFSNTLPLISGPGVNVLSAGLNGTLVALNGTSMACPHVAGVAALTWQEVQSLPIPASATSVRAKLLARARPDAFEPNVDVQDRGAGMVTSPLGT